MSASNEHPTEGLNGSALVRYIDQHAKLLPRDPAATGTDVYFFTVQVQGDASADTLRALVDAHNPAFGSVDVFDGKEHGYIELGGWLGSQRHALALIGLGVELGLWRLLSPRTVLGKAVPADIEESIAGMGLISLLAPLTPAEASPES